VPGCNWEVAITCVNGWLLTKIISVRRTIVSILAGHPEGMALVPNLYCHGLEKMEGLPDSDVQLLRRLEPAMMAVPVLAA